RVAEDAVNLGSLVLLAASTIDTATPIDKPPIRLEVPTFHIAIMNPPFTRSVGGNLQFGDFSPEARRALQDRLRRLLHGLGLTGIGQAGLSAAFIALADLYLATEGCLAMVLPKTLLSGVAWQKIRTLLIGKYHIEAVIASFEGPDAWNFSENTSLSEILLVAQKRALTTLDAPRTYTIFANLWRKPRTEQEARHLGSQLLNLRSHATHHQLDDIDVPLFPLILSGKQVGEAYTLHLTEPTFGFYQLFAQGQLNRTTTLLRTDALHLPGASAIHKLPLAPLASFVSGIGPDVRQIHDTFRRSFQEHESQTDRLRQSYPALWNHKTKQIRTISQQPNAILTSRKPEAATRLWQKGSASLLVVERAWLATVRVLATVTSEPVLSNVWWTLRTKAIKLQDRSHLAPNHVSQLLALWFNSTPGLLLLLSHAEVTRGPWIKIKKRHLRNLSVFDFTILTKPQVATLLKVYQEIEKQPLKPLPREYATPQLRRRLDGIISSILRLDTDWGSLYSKLACDP
ncbi:MAG: hypothetical protein ACFFCO_11870, partial [Promethearchaeota archaeon]